MTKGDTLVAPNLGWPDVNLDPDQQVRCLSHLIRRLDEFTGIPHGLKAKVIAAQYLGGPYPAIGLYVEDGVEVNPEEIPRPLGLEAKLDAYILKVGLQKLVEMSAEETLTWADVLSRSRIL